MKRIAKKISVLLACLTVFASVSAFSGCEDALHQFNGVFDGIFGGDASNEISLDDISSQEGDGAEASEEYEWTEEEVETPSAGIEYLRAEEGGYYVVKSIGYCVDTEVVIPSTYNTLPVKAIAENAFYGNATIKSVWLPDAVETIGRQAFYGCYALERVRLGNGVTELGDGAFVYCTSLLSVQVDENNAVYQSKNGNVYTKDGKTLVQYAAGKKATKFTIPDGVTSIGAYALTNSQSLADVVIADSVTNIGEYAFYKCLKLTDVVFGDGVEEIGEYAFGLCKKLQIELSLPNALKNIGANAFAQCGIYGKLHIPDNVTEIGERAFYKCDDVTELVLGEKVESIGGYAFYGCKMLAGELVFPSNLKNIKERAFAECYFLTKITWGGKEEKIGNYAFYACEQIAGEIILPDTLKSVGDYAFSACKKVGSVTIGAETERIGIYAFSDCVALKEVKIGAAVNSIGIGAFSACSKLERAIFASTAGWQVSMNADMSNVKSVAEENLSDSATAAKCLIGHYYAYYWKKA